MSGPATWRSEISTARTGASPCGPVGEPDLGFAHDRVGRGGAIGPAEQGQPEQHQEQEQAAERHGLCVACRAGRMDGKCEISPSSSTRLVYTRSRNAKLKLIGDYLRRTPDPDRGYALAALTGELDLPGGQAGGDPRDRRGTGRPHLVLHELGLCRRHGRDRVPALAEADRPAGRARRRHAAHRQRRRAARRRSAAPRRRARSPACSTISTPAAATPCSSSPPASSGSASRRGSPRPRWLRPSASTSMRSRRSGTASARLICRCSPGRRARGRSRRRRTSRSSARSCSPIRSRICALSLDDYAAEWKWDGIRVQIVRAGGETRLYSRAGDDISRSFPEVAEAFRRDGVRRRRAAGQGRVPGRRGAWRRGGELQRAPAAARPQDRLGEDAEGLSRPSSGSTTSCSTARRICGRCPGRSAARGWRRSCRSSIPSGSTSRR